MWNCDKFCFYLFCRALSELSHRIDEVTGKCSKVEDLFSPALVSLRLKLRECSGASIKFDEYISGALDISWRKASYEVLHVAKRQSDPKLINSFENYFNA